MWTILIKGLLAGSYTARYIMIFWCMQLKAKKQFVKQFSVFFKKHKYTQNKKKT